MIGSVLTDHTAFSVFFVGSINGEDITVEFAVEEEFGECALEDGGFNERVGDEVRHRPKHNDEVFVVKFALQNASKEVH